MLYDNGCAPPVAVTGLIFSISSPVYPRTAEIGTETTRGSGAMLLIVKLNVAELV